MSSQILIDELTESYKMFLIVSKFCNLKLEKNFCRPNALSLGNGIESLIKSWLHLYRYKDGLIGRGIHGHFKFYAEIYSRANAPN